MNDSATKKLKELAKHPVDLTNPVNFTPERIENFVSHGSYFSLLYATERVDLVVLEALKELALQALVINKMQAMQDGAVINNIQGFPSENRAVLHTATRDFFAHPNPSKEAKIAAALSLKEVEKLKKFMETLDTENKFTTLVAIGIGGSDLGPRAHYLALQPYLKEGRSVRFISNVDPDDAVQALLNLDLRKTLVVVISKSGTTLETLANEAFVKDRFIKDGLDPKNHFIAVTGEKSPMDNKTRYLESFYIWDWIGGRYSTTSMVGGVMLSFAFGFDVYFDLLKGANEMDKTCLNEDFNTNLPLLGASLSVWNRSFLNIATLALIPYSQALSRYSAHIQQVEMESNGKHINKEGQRVTFATAPIIWGESGTNGQHSFYQLIHQGTDMIALEFVGFLKSQYGIDHEIEGSCLQEMLLSNLFAQAIALAVGQKSDNPNKEFLGNRPSHILLAEKLTPKVLGALLSYFENKVAFEGFLWGINSFDQEGVQLGKVLAQKVINCFSKESDEKYPLGQAYVDQLKKIKKL